MEQRQKQKTSRQVKPNVGNNSGDHENDVSEVDHDEEGAMWGFGTLVQLVNITCL